jgi:hypothetical protein
MKVSVEMEGGEQLQKIIDRAASDSGARAGLEQAMFGFATKILNESKKIIPIDTGSLRNSGRVEDPKVSNGVIEVAITYGGSGAPYAAIVHEDMTMDHSPSKLTAVTKRPRRGQAKFLEIPVMANAPSFARDIAARYARYIRRGG